MNTKTKFVVLGEADAASVRIECDTFEEVIRTVRTLERFGFLCHVCA